jgi:hypothetical protein
MSKETQESNKQPAINSKGEFELSNSNKKARKSPLNSFYATKTLINNSPLLSCAVGVRASTPSLSKLRKEAGARAAAMEEEPRPKKRIVINESDQEEEAEAQFDVEMELKLPSNTNSPRSQRIAPPCDTIRTSPATEPTLMDGPDPEEEATPTPDAENEGSPHLRAGARLRSERKASARDEPEPAGTSDSEVGARNGYSSNPLREKGNWLETWLDTYGVTASGLSLFNRAVLLPTCPGLSIRGEPEAQELLVVGDLDREDIPMVVNHILFLVQNLKRIRTT